MAIFYTYENSPENDKINFLRTLYHDRRGGQMIRLRKNGDQVDQLSTCDMDELAATGTDLVDTYTTVHTFRGYKRVSDKVFNYGSIYIDLDCHAKDQAQIEGAKSRTVEILEAAYADGSLAVPTMITDTGRGFGLQYVLTRSIAKTWKTEKIQAFYKKTRKCLYGKYREIFSADPEAAQPDIAVMDDARVCRIPGTYNVAADRICRLISVSGKKYELSDIVQECHLWDWKTDEEYQREKEEKKQKQQRLTSRTVVSFAEYKMPFLATRLEQLEQLQTLRGTNCAGCREQMLFIAYSALKQLDPGNATLRLQEINRKFSDPLPQAEVDHIIAETDGSVGIDHSGYYKLPNSYVIDTLGLTDAEIKTLGIGQGLKRAADRKAARDRKNEVRKKVIELLSQADRLTYSEIAITAGVSRGTVCTIAKAEGLMRYAKAAQRQNSQKKAAEIIAIESVQEEAGQAAKSTKITTGSVCGAFSDSGCSVLSTPSVRGSGGEDLDWCEWLDALASSNPVARELYYLFEWSDWESSWFGSDIENYLDRHMPMIMKHPDRLSEMHITVARKFFRHYKDDLDYLFGMHKVADVLPTVWNLYVTAGQRKTGYHQKKHPEVDVATETPEQREARINRHLNSFSDKRFDIIEASDEYQRRLDPDVIRMVKTACMQVVRLKRDFFWIEKQKIQTSDIKQCFNSLTYKDLVVLCERMAHQGTIRGAETPFYYVLQTVWKYTHPDAAEAQADRIKSEKHVNGFNNFESHTYDFDIGKFMEINAIRKITGQSPLSQEEFINKEGELYGNGR